MAVTAQDSVTVDIATKSGADAAYCVFRCGGVDQRVLPVPGRYLLGWDSGILESVSHCDNVGGHMNEKAWYDPTARSLRDGTAGLDRFTALKRS